MLKKSNSIFIMFILFTILQFTKSGFACVDQGGAQSRNAEARLLEQQSGDEVLTANQIVQKQMTGNAAHNYKADLNAEDYIKIIVEQKDINIKVELFDPDGMNLLALDQTGIPRNETVQLIAQKSGFYIFRISPSNKRSKAGHYSIRIEDKRAATDNDRLLVQAESSFDAGYKNYLIETDNTLKRSLSDLNSALSLFNTINDTGGIAKTLALLGEVYDSLSDRNSALEYYYKSLAIYEKNDDKSNMASLLVNIAYAYRRMGELQKALKIFNDAIPLLHETGVLSGEASALHSVGTIKSELGNYQQGLADLKKALSIWQQISDEDGEALSLHNTGKIYRDLDQNEEALYFFNRALLLRERLGSQKNFKVAVGFLEVGSTYEKLQDYRQAKIYLLRGLAILKEIKNRFWEAIALYRLGKLYTTLKKRGPALRYLNQSLALSKDFKIRFCEAMSLATIGDINYLVGDYSKAVEFYDRALAILGSHYGPDAQAKIHYKKARIDYLQGRLLSGYEQITRSINLMEQIREKIATPESRTSLFSEANKYYELCIDLLMALNKVHPDANYDLEAFNISERRRARGLVDLLVEAQVDIREGVDSGLLERESKVLTSISEKQYQLLQAQGSKEPDRTRVTRLEQELSTLIIEFQEVEAEIRIKSPHQAELGNATPISLKEVQENLIDQDTVLLEYSLGLERSYVWMVTNGSLVSFELSRGAVIEKSAKKLIALLRSREVKPGEAQQEYSRRVRTADALYDQAAIELSRLVIKPVATQLGAKRLLIVADGALQYVPFAALPKVTAGKDVNKSPAPLVFDHEIVNLPSASAAAYLRKFIRERRPADKMVAVLADPVFDPEDERVINRDAISQAARNNQSEEVNGLASVVNRSAADVGLKFNRLLLSRDEATGILSVTPPSRNLLALDFEANLTTVKSPALAAYRFVHFATHGIINTKRPQLSGIVLSLVDKSGAEQDGFLRLQDIYSLKMPAELVVLSACVTGIGKEVKGEGLITITRGFMHAGAARVLASLWKVDDNASAKLMVVFYKKMLGEEMLSPAAALKAAQLELLKSNYRSPYYWAAFVLQGEWNDILR